MMRVNGFQKEGALKRNLSGHTPQCRGWLAFFRHKADLWLRDNMPDR